MLKTEKWKQEIKNLEKKLSELLIESASIGIDGIKEDNESPSVIVNHTKNIVQDKSNKILTEHDKRGLYALTDNKSKESVEFPTFNDKRGESVFEF